MIVMEEMTKESVDVMEGMMMVMVTIPPPMVMMVTIPAMVMMVMVVLR